MGEHLYNEDDDEDVIPEFATPFAFISAGDTLTLTRPAGTFATLEKNTEEVILGYALNDNGPDIPGPAPDGLVLDIPGEEFPAYSNVGIPDVPQINFTLSSGASLNSDSVLTWQPSNIPNAFVDIFATSFNGTVARVECSVEDDGSFEFPQATQDAMTGRFLSNTPGFARTVYSVTEDQTSVLLLVNTTAN